MSFQTTVDSINQMKAELERATAVTTVEKPDGTSESVPGEFSCERLELLLDEHVSAVTNVLDGKTAEIAAIMSKYAPILSIPSDPLKIIGWAKKVVTGMVDPQLSAAIKLATELAQLAGALADLASAVANAATRLADCIESEIRSALDGITDSLMQNATSLFNQATSIYEDIRDDALDQLNYNELLALSTDVQTQIGELDTALTDIGDTTTSIQNSINGLTAIQIPA